MKVKSFTALALLGLTTISSGAFASGYGPAPHYNPAVGAPASQRGQSVETVAAEKNAVSTAGTAYSSVNGRTTERSKELAGSYHHAPAAD